MKRLPKKLSDRILVALADLEKCEADPKYKIDMDTFHEPKQGICEVCLAGSVMAQTLEANHSKDQYPWHFVPELEDQLNELDDIREGYGKVWPWFEPDEQDKLGNMSLCDRPQWKLHMLDIVGRLQAEGL